MPSVSVTRNIPKACWLAAQLASMVSSHISLKYVIKIKGQVNSIGVRTMAAAMIDLIAVLGLPVTTPRRETMTDPHPPVTAIDIALEPDAVMISRALADNAALRENVPQGFALDATHHAHVTLLQCFVRTADLPSIYAATEKVLAKEKYTEWKLTAFKYYYVPAGPIGLAGIVVEPTTDLIRLQQQIIDALAPYTVNEGAAAAFYTTPAKPDIHPSVIPYVRDFVPDHTGKNYSPHVSTGVGTTAFLDALLAKPFEAFTFSPASASVYQLGNYGTARKELRALPAKP
jgi:hypothetical protein